MSDYELDSAPTNNLDHVLIHHFVNGGPPSAIASNPLAVLLAGYLLQVDTAAGMVQMRFAPDHRFLQGKGVIQGGIVCAMLDFAMAFAVLARLRLGDGVTTVNLNASFLRSAGQGIYVASGYLDQLGNNLAFSHASLTAADGSIVATACSTLKLFR
jgi:uncharacterized protein (TIGR00369 family)